jgi:DNA-binding NarL/FixJ family response regulator
MPLRCLIVDDNAPFLADAAALLTREGLTVVGVASTANDALERVAELRPDVALVDIFLGADSGFDLARRLPSSVRVILVSTHAAADFAELIEEAPVAGFVPKAELSGEAIRRLVDAA